MKKATADQISLDHFTYDVPIVLQTDASNLGIGATLINRHPPPVGDRIVGLVSHAFNATEARWKTIEQEAWAIVFAIIFFRSLLWGHNFLVETDHRNLTFIHSGTSSKLTRWSLLLQSMSFAISYLPGEQNVTADALSRSPRGLRMG
ncbi:MAG: Ty3/Gypsy family RNase HI domain-containing protein, partial [bacterium]